jgi:hypothetical protein
MMSVEEHGAILYGLMRQDHEEFVAKVQGWAERAEVAGRTAAARQHRDHLAALEAMPKPWEFSQVAPGQ